MTTSGIELGRGSAAGFFSGSAGAGCSVAGFPLPSGETGAGTISAGEEDSCSRASRGNSASSSTATTGAPGIRK
jgi:hypothetical protein